MHRSRIEARLVALGRCAYAGCLAAVWAFGGTTSAEERAATEPTLEVKALRSLMDDAQDSVDELADAIDAKSPADARAALARLEEFGAGQARYWRSLGTADAIALSEDATRAVQVVSAAVAAGRFDGGRAGVGLLRRACAACHDRHFERTAAGGA